MVQVRSTRFVSEALVRITDLPGLEILRDHLKVHLRRIILLPEIHCSAV